MGLQRMIDRAARFNTLATRAEAQLNEWCEKRYGAAPGDLDADYILDAVYGTCGESSGMPAEEFDRIMKELTQ